MRRVIALATALLVLGSLQASATETKASIDARLQQELGRIEQGRQAGTITWREGLHLRAEANKIALRERELLDDHGKLTKKDRAELTKDERGLSQDIETKANNGWRRPAWLPRVGQ